MQAAAPRSAAAGAALLSAKSWAVGRRLWAMAATARMAAPQPHLALRLPALPAARPGYAGYADAETSLSPWL